MWGWGFGGLATHYNIFLLSFYQNGWPPGVVGKLITASFMDDPNPKLKLVISNQIIWLKKMNKSIKYESF